MFIDFDEEMAQKVKELAIEMGLADDEVVQEIVKWYFEDNEK